MGVTKYVAKGKTWWRVDEWLLLPDGRLTRYRKKKVPTREQAALLAAKVKTDAFEGRFLERKKKAPSKSVKALWNAYEPITKRDNDSWQTNVGRARHLLRHLGDKLADQLSLKDIDAYRNARFAEVTRRKLVPAPGTVDREVALLLRVLNYSVSCGELPRNPLAGVKLLRKPNIRRTVVTEEAFEKLLGRASEAFRPILLVAYDHGLRKGEILDLTWEQLDLKEGVIRLAPQDTKGGEHRVVYLTSRTLAAIAALPRRLHATHVFVNPETGERWKEVRRMFSRACAAAGLKGVWFHDLRRSFVTNARRRGIPESVVMKLSGHRTRAVFERYNVVSEDDLKSAVRQLEAGAAAERAATLGHVLDTVAKTGAGRRANLPESKRALEDLNLWPSDS
jgi:integrase